MYCKKGLGIISVVESLWMIVKGDSWKELVGGNGSRGMVGIDGVRIMGKMGSNGKIGVMVERLKIEGNMYCCSD